MTALLGTLGVFALIGLVVASCAAVNRWAGTDPTDDPGGPYPWA